jgi:predicted permease
MAFRRRVGAWREKIVARPFTGFAVPHPVETFLKMPGGAAFPCALVAPRLFLAPKSEAISNQTAGAALLAGLKLVRQPIIA